VCLKPHWSIDAPPPDSVAGAAAELGVAPLVGRCLCNRGYRDGPAIEEYLHPRLARLRDPFDLPDMAAAVERLGQARVRREPVVIFGDYDVDGVTATALLEEAMGALGWAVDCYLPRRLDEGYGLSLEAAGHCRERHAAPLWIAVDCGSTSVEAIGWLGSQGVDVIVVDHHQLSSPAPAARALVNPRRMEGSGGSGEAAGDGLCSAGLAFKLAHALVKDGRRQGWVEAVRYDLRSLLDLVALGTVADLVPLRGENRILVAHGLGRLGQTDRPGLRALKEISQVGSPVKAVQVGFQLAPRLNAAGRLQDAEAALRLLQARDPSEAARLAGELDARNRQRQAIEQEILAEVIRKVQAQFDPERDYVIVEGSRPWHIGVVGIVATRVLRQYHRPTIILGGDGGLWRGSGRSIEGFDLAAGLRACGDLLVRHGGHAQAAGLTLDPANVDRLRDRLNAYARDRLRREDLRRMLRLDAEVTLGEMTRELVEQLNRLEPVGSGNPPAQFAALGLRCVRPAQRMGRDQQHVKLQVTDGRAASEAVWWGAGDAALPEGPFDLAFAPRLNEYQGRCLVQLHVLGWRPAS